MIAEVPGADWRSPQAYADLLSCDRRAFAWEWLRRNRQYRRLWTVRRRLATDMPAKLGLLGWVDPALPSSKARPIWSVERDRRVLRGRPALESCDAEDHFDIRTVAAWVSVEVDADHTEHWLLSDGHWAIRLDLQDGTLLGGPVLVEHRIIGLEAAKPKIEAIRQFVVLAQRGDLPPSMVPRERRAAQWIAELRVGDALLDQAGHQDMARALFGTSIAERRWRVESSSYRLRVQRLARIARNYLEAPLSGPWFD